MTSSQGSRPDAPDGRDELIGCVLDDRYRLEERIGGGGMGQVYRARHLRMDQAVAVKVLHPDLSADPSAARRFAREARHTFRFDHPHCVRVMDFGATPSGTLFLVMEYLTGRTAAQEIEVDGPMAPARVMHLARQVCDALAYAHELGFVHRDIKPDNVMLLHRGGDPDFVKVLDFGLAKLFAGGDALQTAAFSAFALTREGSVFGTAEYMSPEQAMGQPLGPTADVYSLGTTMYELLTASLPFEGRTFTEVLAQQVQKQPVPPVARRPDLAIPAALNGLILACMAKAPGERPQSAHTLAAEIDRIALGPIALGRTALGRASTLATAETMDLEAVTEAAFPDPDPGATGIRAGSVAGRPASHGEHAAGAHAVAGSSAHSLPGSAAPPASSVQTAQTRAHAGGAQRRMLALTAAVVVLGAAALGLALWSRTTAGGATPAQPASPAALAQVARAAAAPATDEPAAPTPAPAAPAAPAAINGAAPGANPGPAPATPGSAAGDRAQPASAPASGEDEDEERRSRKRDVARHLAAAEGARRQSNRLKQIAEADSALRLEPGNRQAAFLLGDALLASGDEDNACKYLRRARGLTQARAALRRASCPGD
jgi:serine/threonine-protein kinase